MATKRKDAVRARVAPTAKKPGRNKDILGQNFLFTPTVIDDIHIKAELGRYRMRGMALFKKIPTWDDLTFLPGTLTRFVIEGYREKCETRTVIGPKAKRPIVLDIPAYITGMSFGALSFEAKIALARGATMAGSATCSGEGGMIPHERRFSEKWFYQCIQSRYGFNPHHAQLADGIEIFIGQGCKVGLGGHLMGQKVTDQVAEMRSLPAGIDQRSPARHPDWLGPDDLALKINELREATDGQIPIQLKLGAARVYDDVRMAAKTGPDSIYLDGMEGSTGAGPHLATEETGVPGIAAIRQARRALDDVGTSGEISLVYAGGIRNGADLAKALALGADAVAIGTSAMVALNCNKDIPGADFEGTIGVPAGYCYHCHTGRCPVGVATQDPKLRARLDPDAAAERVYNFLHTLTMECQMMARACGKTDVHSLEPEDLAALTMEASALAGVPLAGTDYTVGYEDYHHLKMRRGGNE
jgi:glutamate synthase domain-containing protein 2